MEDKNVIKIRHSGVHIASYEMGMGGGVSPWIKRPGREADYSSPATAEFKNAWNYTPTVPYIFIARLPGQAGNRYELHYCKLFRLNEIYVEMKIFLIVSPSECIAAFTNRAYGILTPETSCMCHPHRFPIYYHKNSSCWFWPGLALPRMGLEVTAPKVIQKPEVIHLNFRL
jgi:hypothetical protein